MLELLASGGIVNKGLNLFRLAEGNMNLMADPNKFYMIFTVISIIKSIGYGSILYISAITSVDQDMYEAAYIDGANRFQKIIYYGAGHYGNYRNHADFSNQQYSQYRL